jgi:hypothetical protein
VRVGLARDDLTGELVFNRYLARGDDPDAVQGLLAAAAPKWCGSLRVWKGPRDQIPIDVSDRGAGRHRAGSCRRAGRDLLRDGGAVRPPRPRGTKPRSRVERARGIWLQETMRAWCVRLSPKPGPQDWDTPDYAAVGQRVRDHLGAELFFAKAQRGPGRGRSGLGDLNSGVNVRLFADTCPASWPARSTRRSASCGWPRCRPRARRPVRPAPASRTTWPPPRPRRRPASRSPRHRHSRSRPRHPGCGCQGATSDRPERARTDGSPKATSRTPSVALQLPTLRGHRGVVWLSLLRGRSYARVGGPLRL